MTTSFIGSNGRRNDDNDTLEAGLPFTNSSDPISMKHRMSDAAQSTGGGGASASAIDIKPSPTSPTSDGYSEHDHEPDASSSPRRGRFVAAVRSVMTLQSASGISPLAAFAPRPQRQRTSSSTMSGVPESAAGRKLTMDPVTTLSGSRVASLIPKLKTLEPTQDLAAHQGLVRHLQFSPDGKFLATSRCVLLPVPVFLCLTLVRITAGIEHPLYSVWG